MATAADRGAGIGVRREEIVACCLTAALLTTACAGSIPRLVPPPDLSATDREACETLAGTAKAEVRGDSVLGGAAKGAAVGTLGSVYTLARGNTASEQGLYHATPRETAGMDSSSVHCSVRSW